MLKYLLLPLIIFLIGVGTAQADFYKWEDENGIIHITDYPPAFKSSKNIRVHKQDYSVQEKEEQEISKDGQNKVPDVVLYTKDSCSDCDNARAFLKSKNISFTEYNTDSNKEAAKKRKLIDDSDDAPFAIINKIQVYGFSESVYTRALKAKP